MCNLSTVVEEKGIVALVKALRKLKQSDDDIIQNIMEEFGLSKEEARE